MMEELPDLRELENKLGRKVPESLIRSFSGGSAQRGPETRERADPSQLQRKLSFLRQQMALLRAVDVALMRQLLSVHEGIESVRWALEERGGGASLAGSLCSLSDSPGASPTGSCSDGLDGISVGSYLDTLAEDEGTEGDEQHFRKRPLEEDEYYCFR